MEKPAEPTTATLAFDGELTADTVVGEKGGTITDIQDMKRMGKQQLFKRNFRFYSIFAFAMVLMSTWEALLGTIAFGLGNGGTAGLIYVYMAVAFFFFLVILSMAEMASIAPTAGGQYHWVSEFAPPSVQKPLSFCIGWLCVLGWQTGCAIGCFLAATEIQGLVVLNNENYVPQRWHGTLMTVAMAVFITIFNTVLVRFLPVVEAMLLVLHLVGFVAIIVPLWVLADRSPSQQVWTVFEDAGGWGSTGLACLVGMLSPITSLLGADAATHMSEELKNASKSLPRAMICTSVFNGTLGFIMVITFCYTVGNVEEVLATPTGFPFIQVFYNSTGSRAGATVMTSIMVILAAANALTNMATASRQLFAFARDRGVPFHSWFQQVPAEWDIPFNSILFTLLITSLLSLINIGSLVAFNQILSLGVCALLSSYIVSISCITYRRLIPLLSSKSDLNHKPFPPSHFNLGRLGLPVNILSLAFLVVALVVSFFPPVANPPALSAQTMNWSCVVYVGVLSGAGVYYFVQGWWADEEQRYVGPVVYVKTE